MYCIIEKLCQRFGIFLPVRAKPQGFLFLTGKQHFLNPALIHFFQYKIRIRRLFFRGNIGPDIKCVDAGFFCSSNIADTIISNHDSLFSFDLFLFEEELKKASVRLFDSIGGRNINPVKIPENIKCLHLIRCEYPLSIGQ